MEHWFNEIMSLLAGNYFIEIIWLFTGLILMWAKIFSHKMYHFIFMTLIYLISNKANSFDVDPVVCMCITGFVVGSYGLFRSIFKMNKRLS